MLRAGYGDTLRDILRLLGGEQRGRGHFIKEAVRRIGARCAVGCVAQIKHGQFQRRLQCLIALHDRPIRDLRHHYSCCCCLERACATVQFFWWPPAVTTGSWRTIEYLLPILNSGDAASNAIIFISCEGMHALIDHAHRATNEMAQKYRKLIPAASSKV